MEPERIVYVSCDSATLARDVKYLRENGYEIRKVKATDMFPMSVHVETVVLLSKGQGRLEKRFGLSSLWKIWIMSEFQRWSYLSADQGVCVGAYRIKGVQPLYLTD